MIGQLNIGAMDQRITLQDPTEGQGATYSERTQAWATTATVWAEVGTNSSFRNAGRELYKAQQINAEVSNVFVIRYRTGVTAKTRIFYQNRYYDIVEIFPVGRNVGLQIWAKARMD